MTLIEYPDVEQRSDEWHDLRRGMVTASTVAQLLTPTLKVACNDTSRAVTASLVAERITGHTEWGYISGDMLRGQLHEPIARGYYEEHFAPVTEMGFMVLERDRWTLGYSPDGLVGDEGLLEIKAPKPTTHIRTILAGEIPTRHMAQVQAGLLVTGRKWLDFCSFFSGLPLFVTRVYPDPQWFEAIEAACRVFEENAREMVAQYRSRVVGMPMTERVPDDLELVV